MIKKPFAHLSRLVRALMTLLTVMSVASSCTMMTEDLPECEARVCVYFKYDYNIQRADMFHDHVGMVHLFVIDAATQQVVRDTVVSNRDHLNAIKNDASRLFSVTLPDLPMGRQYTFQAIAFQRPYDELVTRPEDHFLMPLDNDIDPTGASRYTQLARTDLKVHLTHAATADADGRHPVHAPSCGLDTLWMGHTLTPVALPAQAYGHITVCDTISMVRDTKYLDIALFTTEKGKEADMRHEDYRLEITDDNCRLDWNNDVLAHARLQYTPHTEWTVEHLNDEGVATKTSARYEISFSRLLASGADPTKAARLRIIRNADDVVIVNINLPSYLAAGRSAYEWYYTEQEYLDREYHYGLDFFLVGDTWEYLNVQVNVTPWTIRRDNIWL